MAQPLAMVVGRPGDDWMPWVKQSYPDRDLFVLDPGLAEFGPAGRVCLVRSQRAVDWRFVGSTDLRRDPVAVLSAAFGWRGDQKRPAVALCFPFHPSPMVRHLCLELAQTIRPDEMFVTQGSGLEKLGWPVGPHEADLGRTAPPLVRDAQRRARWIGLLDECQPHEVLLTQVSVQGTRLGSGTELTKATRQRCGLDWALYAEVCGKTLFAITGTSPSASEVNRAADLCSCSKAVLASPESYRGLLCAFARQEGHDFGMGVVEEIDFEFRVARVRNTAVPPAPVRILKLGSLRIAENGKEITEARPWSI